MSNKLQIRLALDLTYTAPETDTIAGEVIDVLNRAVNYLLANGMLTGNTAADLEIIDVHIDTTTPPRHVRLYPQEQE